MQLEVLTTIGAILFAVWGGYERYLRVIVAGKEINNLNADLITQYATAANQVVEAYNKLADDLKQQIEVLTAKVARLEGLIMQYGCQKAADCPMRELLKTPGSPGT